MKKFLVTVLLMLSLVLVVDVLYVFTVGGTLRAYAEKYFGLGNNIRVLVVGDSHANRAWASDNNPTVYNFAYGSDNINDMRAKFLYAANENHFKGKKIVVLSFEPHLISAYRETKHNNRLNAVLNLPYVNMRVVNAMPLIFDPTTEFDVKRFLLSLYKKPRGEAERAFTKAHAISRFKDQYPDATGSKILIVAYQQLIDDIRSRGYEMAAVKYPVHPFFDSLVRTDPRSRYLTEKMDSLASVNHLEVHDFSNTINDPELFLDQDHLNAAGSAVFVREFNKVFLN